MQLFSRKIKSNGGVCGSQLELIEVSNVDVWPEATDLKQLENITLQAGAEWINVPFIRGSVTPNEPTDLSGGTKYYKNRLPGTVNGVDNVIRNSLLSMEDKELIIKFTALDKTTYLIGSPSHPASLQIINRKIGGNARVRNDISVLVSAVSKYPFLTAH